ncbi:MAG: apolipoprotein N-acyltransferase [Deltaproteobacteria bacterium]|nr:apolipoprotein N-acyltransferase [Deltaproteobacteria bacterium]
MGSLPAKKILLALLSGLLMSVSFPPLKTDWFIWFSIIPLLMAIEDTSPAEAFRLGIIAGLSHYLSLIYWIINVLSTYGGLNFVISAFILLLLCLYLSLYIGLFSFLTTLFSRSKIKIFFFAGIWVSMEFLRGLLLTGFPWGLLGYSQYNRLELAQIADITGVYGISFIIVAFNVLFFQLILNNRQIFKNKYLISEGMILLLIAFASVCYGHNRLIKYRTHKPDTPKINVAVIQGNIDQAVKWDEEFREETVEKYIRLTRRSYHTQPDIIIWPETAVPFFFQDENPLSKKISDLARESDAHLIFGSPAYREESGRILYYNSAWCISPDGSINGQYNKNHLVPFGEYVPLHNLLPFIYRLVPAAGDFSRGDSIDPILLDDISSGILICYEVIFPTIARGQVIKGAGILINITNDAWFGISSAPYQHLFISVFRAIENRRPLIRSANTGISAIISATGEVVLQGDLLTEEVLTGKITPGKDLFSFYSSFGDIFATGILFLCLINISIGLFHSGRTGKE